MINYELLIQPYKKIKFKIQLIGSSQATFPWLKKYILWNELEGTVWSELLNQTWEQASQHSSTDGKDVIKDIEGDAVSLFLSVDRSSDIRRVISLSMHLDDDEYFESTFITIWLNRLIQVEIGILDAEREIYVWFPLGVYMVTNNTYKYDASNKKLQLSVADLMASVTEERGNQIGSEVVIHAGTPMKEALSGTVERFFPFTLSRISTFLNETIPYDLKFNRGVFPYEIAKRIVTLYPTYEHFYNVHGEYIAQELPTGVDDPLVLTADEMDGIIISEEGSSAPKDIKNIAEVWGRELDSDHTASSCDGVTMPNTYSLFIDEAFTTLEEGMTVAFTADVSCSSGQKLKIQDTQSLNLIVLDGEGQARPVRATEITADVQYVVKYTNGTFVLQGPSQIHAMCFLFNEAPGDEAIQALKSKYGCNDIMIAIDRNSLFSIEWIGERVRVFSDGEYGDIYTTELALERAYYENWKMARIQDTLKLTTIYVPWLDVNQKIEYRSIATKKANEYMVNSIQVNLETFTMTVEVSRFYPYYPWLRDTKTWGDYASNTWGELTELYWDEMTYYGLTM